MKKLTFRSAIPKDEKKIKALLGEEKLPHRDISSGKQDFILALSSGRLAGCVGLQACGPEGLLRSLAVGKGFRGRGLAEKMFERLLALAGSKGVRRLYLLTTTASGLFRKWGFRKIHRKDVPEVIRRTKEFDSLCPSSAMCLKLNLGNEAFFYPGDMLPLRPDAPGSRMWGIALEKAMLTYFVVKPHCRFKRHRHPSEQITLVLQGELFFRTDRKTFKLNQGEAIAIPSNAPHEVYTKGRGAKAVDAWSPVMPIYQ